MTSQQNEALQEMRQVGGQVLGIRRANHHDRHAAAGHLRVEACSAQHPTSLRSIPRCAHLHVLRRIHELGYFHQHWFDYC